PPLHGDGAAARRRVVPRDEAHRGDVRDRRRLRRRAAQEYRRRREPRPLHPVAALMLSRILGIILPVFSIVALGWLYAARVKPDLGWVNRINLTVLMPALVFSALASKDFDLAGNLPLIAGAIGIVLGSGLLAWPLGKLLHQDYRTWIPPMMFNNCGNMGLPLAYLSFGQPGLSAMVTLFTISNLAHFTLGVHIVKRDAALWPILRSPMVVATFLGFAFALTHPPVPEWLTLAIKMVGDAAIPLMLISLGARLAE